jgi:hypothetical protein
MNAPGIDEERFGAWLAAMRPELDVIQDATPAATAPPRCTPVM